MTDLPGVFGTVAPYIEDYGYFAVAALVFIANLGIPVPGDASLVVAAIFTVSEDLSLVPVLIVGWTAAVLGECAAYAIGRYGGRPLAIRLGRRFGVTHDLLDRVEGFYRHHGVKTVIIGRFIPLLRRVNGLVAGVTAMSWRRFLVANMIGAAVWVGVADDRRDPGGQQHRHRQHRPRARGADHRARLPPAARRRRHPSPPPSSDRHDRHGLPRSRTRRHLAGRAPMTG